MATSSSWTPTARSSSSARASRRCSRPRASAPTASASQAAKLEAVASYDLDGPAAPGRRMTEPVHDLADRARGAPDAGAGGEPPVLRRRARHGGGGARGQSVFLRGWGDYLRYSLKLTESRPGPASSPCERGARRHSTVASPPSRRRGGEAAGSTETSVTARRTASRTPTGTSSSSTTRPSATRRPSTCGLRGGTSRSATSAVARRSSGSTTSTCWPRTFARTARSRRTCSATGCTSGSSSTTGPRRAPG